MQNLITEILNIRYPLFQTPMYYLTNAELVAAMSNAGGLGTIGPNAGQAEPPQNRWDALEKMRAEIRKTKTLTDNASKPKARLAFDDVFTTL